MISAAERKRLDKANRKRPVVTPKLTLILMLFAQILGVDSSKAQSSNIIGSWKVEITFGNGESRLFRLEARGSGEGSLLLIDPKSKFWGPTKPSEAKWIQGDEGSVVFSGAVEFLIGNVGRDAGTLVLKGKFGTRDSVAGEAMFFSLDQDPKDPKAKPSKSGSFKATRLRGTDHSNPPSP